MVVLICFQIGWPAKVSWQQQLLQESFTGAASVGEERQSVQIRQQWPEMLDAAVDSPSCVVVFDASHAGKVHIVFHVDFCTINDVAALKSALPELATFNVSKISVKWRQRRQAYSKGAEIRHLWIEMFTIDIRDVARSDPAFVANQVVRDRLEVSESSQRN